MPDLNKPSGDPSPEERRRLRDARQKAKDAQSKTPKKGGMKGKKK